MKFKFIYTWYLTIFGLYFYYITVSLFEQLFLLIAKNQRETKSGELYESSTIDTVSFKAYRMKFAWADTLMLSLVNTQNTKQFDRTYIDSY